LGELGKRNLKSRKKKSGIVGGKVEVKNGRKKCEFIEIAK
jgi:hypothetical protein